VWRRLYASKAFANLAASFEQTGGRFRGRSCDSFRLPGTVEAIFILHFIFSLCRALLWSPQTYQPYNTLTHSQAQRYYPTIRVPEETLPIIQPMPLLQACTCLPYKVTLSRNISLSRCFVSSQIPRSRATQPDWMAMRACSTTQDLPTRCGTVNHLSLW
jgi:hypothetical protein